MNCIKKYKNKMPYIFYAIFLFATLLYSFPSLDTKVISTIIRIIRYICFLPFCYEIIKNYKKISYLDIFLLLLSLLVTYYSGNKHILLTIIVIISIKNYNLKRIMGISFFIFALIFSCGIIFSQIGVFPDWVYTRGETIRHSFGFIYPTDCFSMYLVVVLLFFASNIKNYKYYQMILIELLNIVLYIYTDGRLSFYLINITLLIMLILKNKYIKNKIKDLLKTKFMKIISLLLPFLFFILYIFITISYNNNMNYAVKIDNILSSRINLTVKAFKEHKLTLFGEEIKWNGWGGYGYKEELTTNNNYEYNFVDASYPRILFDYGIVLSVIILIAYSNLLLYMQ